MTGFMSAVIRVLITLVWLLLVLLHAPLVRASVAPRQGWSSNLAGGVDRRGACPASIAKKGSTEYNYDLTGALLSVVLPGKTVTYEVEGSRRRIRRFDGQSDRRYMYQDGLRIVAELDGASQVLSRFVWGTRANVPEYMERGGQRYRFITDQLGSVRLVVDAQSGEIAQRIDYDAWGKVLTDSNPGFQPFGFAGGPYDRDTGLVRFGARDYDAEIGRWTAKDPILFAGGDSNLSGSRSRIKYRVLRRKPSKASVRLRADCFIHTSQGWQVMPAMFTRRVPMSTTKKTK